MSTESTHPAPGATGPPPAPEPDDDLYADERGSGWVAFAGVMLAIIGLMNVVYGIAAIDSANFYINNAKYVFSDLNTWGWIMLAIGVLQFAAGFSIFAGTAWGRWVGALSAGANAMFQLFFLPSYPLLALALFAVDILIIYALVAYGGRGRPELA